MLLVRLLSVILVGALCCVADGAESPADGEVQRLLGATSAPKNVSQILRLVHAVARTATYQEADFYSAAVMQRLFGQHVEAKVAVGEKISIVSMHGFADLVDPDSIRQSPWLAGVWFEARKANNDKWSRMDVTFWGVMPGLGFDEVVETLGPGWTRNPRAERARDFAIMRESFNPPLPRVSHAMGRAIITYPAGTATLVLEFDTEARLHSARSAGGCLGEPNCTALD